jgi:hypothetical protein
VNGPARGELPKGDARHARAAQGLLEGAAVLPFGATRGRIFSDPVTRADARRRRSLRNC